MKTILFSDNYIWALYHFRGGVISHFLNQGYRVITVGPEDKDDIDNSIPGVEYIPVKLNRTGIDIFSNISYFITLINIYRKYKPDIIFHYTIKPILFGSLAAKIAGIPSVSIYSTLSYIFTDESLKYTVARKVLKFAMKFTEYAIFSNDEDMTLLNSTSIVETHKSILLVGGEGVNTSFFNRTHPIQKNDHPVFLMMARLLYQKGYMEYIEAAKIIKQKFPDAEFILYGVLDKGHPSAVPAAVVENDIKSGIINYKGTVENTVPVIQECDCYVLPSFYNEGMNRSLMEALAIGVPIITTDNKGCREMVRDGISGFLIKKQDVSSLADAMLKICSMPLEEKINMGMEGRKLALKVFDEKIVIGLYINIIKSISEGRKINNLQDTDSNDSTLFEPR